MITTADLRDALGVDADAFNEARATQAIEQVSALALVYAGPERITELEEANDAESGARLDAYEQIVKQYAIRVYANPEGALQRSIQQAGSVSYADTSEAAHGLNRNLRRAIRSAVGGSRVATPLYASELD